MYTLVVYIYYSCNITVDIHVALLEMYSTCHVLASCVHILLCATHRLKLPKPANRLAATRTHLASRCLA